MDPVQLRQRIDSVATWRRGDQRAPHKPLLLLLALARVARGEERWIPYEELDAPLRSLLREFGPPRKTLHPEFPFWYLPNDGLWEVEADDEMRLRKGSSNPLKSELYRADARGALPAEVHELLRRDSDLLHEIATTLLREHFPESLWDELLDAIGLERRSGVDRRQRSAEFRVEVLRAYQRRCALCGFDLRVGDVLVGVEAAHIRWHCYAGPDAVSNGLALCSLHHKLFDKGAFTLDEKLVVVASQDLAGGDESLERWVLRHHGQPVRGPQQSDQRPDAGFLEWHRHEVFREPRRA